MRAQEIKRQSARLLLRAFVLALLVQGSSGCIYLEPPNRAFRTPVLGRPAHAQAHGHHKQHRSPDLVYDSRLGVYVVLGHPNHYHDGHRYYRSRKGRWQSSTDMHGKWVTISVGEVPHGLIARPTRNGSRDHAPPAKHDY